MVDVVTSYSHPIPLLSRSRWIFRLLHASLIGLIGQSLARECSVVQKRSVSTLCLYDGCDCGASDCVLHTHTHTHTHTNTTVTNVGLGLARFSVAYSRFGDLTIFWLFVAFIVFYLVLVGVLLIAFVFIPSFTGKKSGQCSIPFSAVLPVQSGSLTLHNGSVVVCTHMT